MSRILAVVLLMIAITVPAMSASEVIVDNTSATLVGTWSTGTASNDYGSNYRYCSITTSAGNTATYTPNLPVTAGDWQVYVWYPSGLSNTTLSAKVTIHHAWGDTVVYPNQTYNYGVWWYLGTFKMNSGTGNYVEIRNAGPDTSKRVIADAVRFYSPSSGVDSSAPVISGVSAFTWYDGVAVSWTTDEASTSQVDYGPTASYGTTTTENMNLVTSHTVYIHGLPGNALRHFRVRSRDGLLNSAQSGDNTWTTASAPVPEWRALWAQSWIDYAFRNSTQVTNYVNACYNAGYNVLTPEIRKAGDAYYFSNLEPRATSTYEPEPMYINDPDPNFDPLQDMINKAHPLGMQVNAWIVTYRAWDGSFYSPPANHVWALHGTGATPWYNDWTMMTSSGGAYTYNLDPGVPGVQDYIAKVVIDLVSNYDIDGVNYDYIRYPGTAYGYNEVTRQRFYSEYGYYPPTSTSDSNWGVWCDYRRQQVTDLVKKVYLETVWRKPWVNTNVDTVGWAGADPNTAYTSTRQYSEVFQNAKAWMEQKIIDTNLCMNYNREYNTTQYTNYRNWSNFLASMQASTANPGEPYGRIGASGPGVYLNSIPDSVTQSTYSRVAGCKGIAAYTYHMTNKDGLPWSDWQTAITSSIFNSAVPVPQQVWKRDRPGNPPTSPTTGIIFGTVTNATHPNDSIYQNWVYQATVQVTGPVTQSTSTDATGTYGFMDLPPGTYTVTCSKSGFTTRIYTVQTILAGDVLRDDFDICPTGQVSVSSPADTIYQAGKALFSLPYEPVDPAPATVMGSIPIDGRLIQWRRATQSSIAYDEWDPDFFGNLSLDQGYWLTVDSPYTITYQAYPGYAGSREQSLPKAGWNIIGCPFPTEHKWADMRITNGTTTVSLEQARDNGWLNSVGVWWDSEYQSSRDVGLTDDYCFTDYLQPWHGHWLRTYVDNLTLTQR